MLPSRTSSYEVLVNRKDILRRYRRGERQTLCGAKTKSAVMVDQLMYVRSLQLLGTNRFLYLPVS
jgi:hypothetical protein